jgi:serine/threonine protein kinase
MDLHRVNIAHRDLKPENLLLEAKDSVLPLPHSSLNAEKCNPAIVGKAKNL